MKSLAVILLFTIFVASAYTQSGRKIALSPTPAPPVEDVADYSESAAQAKRARIRPTFRGDLGIPRSKSANQNTVAQSNATAGDDESVVRVETNLITIPVSVFDRNGLYIPNLRQSDFKIFEDGKEQEITYFGTSDKPFTVVLLIDTSPSTEYRIEEIRRAAVAFVNQLKPQDKVIVIEFDGNVHVLTEATNDRQRIYKAIQRADFGWGTALYDAVDASLRKHLAKVEGRKAVVLFTDGVDTVSEKADYDSTLDLAEESDSLIFPIYYNTFLENSRSPGSQFPLPGSLPDPGSMATDYAVGKKYLEELASYTGGRVFRPEATPGGLTAAFEGIAEELRRQYNIGYMPSEDGKPGQRKQIKVRVNRPNLVIRARDSYIVGSETRKASPAVGEKKD